MTTTKEHPDITNNPLVDTSDATTDAFVKLKNKQLIQDLNSNKVLGETDTKWYTSPVMKSQVYVYTPLDNQQHKYWTSMSIDVQVQDFMGTCELHAPYDSDLMAYWQPIAQFCIVYGSNNGPAKVLFVGRVREVKQSGYEFILTLQNEGWKFQQDAPAKFIEDNVKNKDGLTIIKNIFEALKISGYTISENAAKRLKEVGINSDGNLTLNGKEIEEMPDLLDRLKKLDKADMTKIMGKSAISEKAKEDQLNWKDIYNLNYTLRYSEPTAAMTALNDSSNYSAGSNVYSNNYGSAATAATDAAAAVSGSSAKSSNDTNKGPAIWAAISIIVDNHIKVTAGKKNEYIRRLYNANASWANISKVIQGHQIYGNGLWKTDGQNLATRTILYIKQYKLSASDAYKKAIKVEKARLGDVGSQLSLIDDSITSGLNQLSKIKLW